MIIRRLLASPHLPHTLQYPQPIHTLRVRLRHRPQRIVCAVRKRAGVRGVEEDLRGVDDLVLVASFVGNEGEDFGAAVPASKGGKSPVCLHGGEEGVVIVEGAVGGSGQISGNGTSEDNSEDSVADVIFFRCVKCQDEYSVFSMK